MSIAWERNPDLTRDLYRAEDAGHHLLRYRDGIPDLTEIKLKMRRRVKLPRWVDR
jgi:hypothetical protein